jgi:hypothetical protein
MPGYHRKPLIPLLPGAPSVSVCAPSPTPPNLTQAHRIHPNVATFFIDPNRDARFSGRQIALFPVGPR